MAQEHAPTYYAATANDATRYPPLEGTVKADICVIGGGFSGVATALTMAERGYSVVLLEANRIGWGASGRNGGQMIFGMSGEETIKRQLGEAGARMLREVRYRGHEIIEGRIQKYEHRLRPQARLDGGRRPAAAHAATCAHSTRI